MSIYLHPQTACLWAFSIILKFVLLFYVVRKSRDRHVLFAIFCVFSAITSAALFAYSALNIANAYIVMYWGKTLIESALMFGVAADLFVREFKPLKCMPPWFLRDFGAAVALVMVVGIATEIYFPSTQLGIDGILRTTTRTTTFVICCTVWFISIFSDYFAISWRNRPYGLALGMLWLYSIGVVLSAWEAHLPTSSVPRVWVPRLLAGITAHIIWIYFFRKPDHRRCPATLQLLNDLHTAINDGKETI